MDKEMAKVITFMGEFHKKGKERKKLVKQIIRTKAEIKSAIRDLVCKHKLPTFLKFAQICN